MVKLISPEDTVKKPKKKDPPGFEPQTLGFASERATAGPTTQEFGRDFKTDTVFPGIILSKIFQKYGF